MLSSCGLTGYDICCVLNKTLMTFIPLYIYTEVWFVVDPVNYLCVNIFSFLLFSELLSGVSGFRLSNQPILLICPLQASLEVLQ